MIIGLSWRLFRGLRFGALCRFFWTFAVRGSLSVLRFRMRLRRGRWFPPFVFISVTNACQYRCRGCWVSVDQPVQKMSVALLDHIIRSCRAQGNVIFGLLGGEPLLHEGLDTVLSRHRGAYFQVFTNGAQLDGEVARRWSAFGNVTPLISIEGDQQVSDQRRGAVSVWDRAHRAVDHCVQAGLLTGVATSVCQTNYDLVVNAAWLDRLIDRGVHYMWYYIYRPVGPHPDPELGLTVAQCDALRRFIVQMRSVKPIIIIDANWDASGRPTCPAVEGVSCHVSPWGDIEPCPPVQLSGHRLTVTDDVAAKIGNSAFLASFRDCAGGLTPGCVLMDAPESFAGFAERSDGYDSSGRDSFLSELRCRQAMPISGPETPMIAERQWLYRLGKRYWFGGLGAYG